MASIPADHADPVSEIIAERSLPGGQTLRLARGDLTQEPTDAIVNAANSQLAHGGGVAGAIVRAGGRQIQDESDAWVRQHGPVRHDRPAITSAGNLPSRYVIHAVGPVWGEGGEPAKLAAAVTGALELAEQRGLLSLALPAISTGIFGFPKDLAAEVILRAITDFAEAHPQSGLQDIRLVLIDQAGAQTFENELARRWPP
jgi:O-acetyl-ADP-ribose deacetylase (regulator of RNase III)